MDQIVEGDRDVGVRAEVELGILEHHQARGPRPVVLRGDIQPIGALRPRIDVVAPLAILRDLPARDAVPYRRVGA